MRCQRFLTVILLLAGSVVQAGPIIYSDFSSTDGLSLEGDAAIVGDVLRLTSAQENQRGTVWYASPLDLAHGFSTRFQFLITNPAGSHDANGEPGGDGISFIVGDNITDTTKNNPGGSQFLSPFVVKFDTWENHNVGQNDPSGNFVGIFTNNFATPIAATNLDPLKINLSDGKTHDVLISYLGDTVKVTLDGASVLTKTGIDLSSIQPTYAGLGAATGAAYENHDINSWSLTTVPEPSSFLMFGSGMLALLVVGRRTARRGTLSA